MMRFAKRVASSSGYLRRTSRNCSSMSESAKDVTMSRAALTLRAWFVKGTLAFLGYKIGTTVLFSPVDIDTIVDNLHLTQETVEASEIKLRNDFQAVREAVLARKKKEEEERASN